ncbi:MAG: YIP1 family protein [Pseudomonadota bacterium]
MTNGRGITKAWPTRAPLRSIWRQPLATLARLSHDNPGYGVFVLPVLAGFASFPMAGWSFGEDAVDKPMGYLALSLLSFSPILELLQLFAATFLVSRLAIAFGGRPDSRRLLSAMAWSNAPILPLVPLGIVAAMVGEASLMPVELDGLPATTIIVLVVPVLLLFAVQIGLIASSKALLVCGCAQALGLSRGRTLLCLLSAWLLSAVLIALVVFASLDLEAVGHVLFAGLLEAFLGFE